MVFGVTDLKQGHHAHTQPVSNILLLTKAVKFSKKVTSHFENAMDLFLERWSLNMLGLQMMFPQSSATEFPPRYSSSKLAWHAFLCLPAADAQAHLLHLPEQPPI